MEQNDLSGSRPRSISGQGDAGAESATAGRVGHRQHGVLGVGVYGLSTTSRRPRCWARVTGRSSPALATRLGSSNAIWMRSGWLRGSIYWVLLVLGSALLFQNHYPRFTGAPSGHFRTLPRRPPSVDSGLSIDQWGNHPLRELWQRLPPDSGVWSRRKHRAVAAAGRRPVRRLSPDPLGPARPWPVGEPTPTGPIQPGHLRRRPPRTYGPPGPS